MEAVPDFLGRSAERGCVVLIIGAAGRVQLYLRCPVTPHDLTHFSELRFRLCGQLQEGSFRW